MDCVCGCGAPARRKWASDACRLRARQPSRMNLPFVEIQAGEGWTSVGDVRVESGSFLRTMRFLLDATDGKKAEYIGYRLNRMVSIWLAELPAETLSALMDREGRTDQRNPALVWPVRYDGFKLDFLPDHFFYVKYGRRKLRIHDVWRFFGIPKEKLAGALPEVMDRFREGCKSVGVLPRAWEGPGSGASVLLGEWGIKDHLAWDLPDPVRNGSRYAYFGHRFEVMLPGQHRRLWRYDVRAAYPWAACRLPAWDRGRWIQGAHSELRLVHVAWKVPAGRSFGPFPWRYPDGLVCYPRSGTGWVWSPEFYAASEIWGPSCFEVLDHWSFVGDGTPSPWEPSKVLWPKRAAFPPLKKFMNAAPGKLAQSWPHPGPWFDPVSAGAVTSVVRGRMLELMARAGKDLVAVIGDGLLCRTEADLRDLGIAPGDQPGDVSVDVVEDALVVQPSIYFGGEHVSAKEDASHVFAGARALFESAWCQAGTAAEVEIPYRHQVSIAEGLKSKARIGKWVEGMQTVTFAAPRKRVWEHVTYRGQKIDIAGERFRRPPDYAITRPLPAPDPLAVLQHVPEGMAHHSWPFWDEEFRPLTPPSTSWPAAEDET